MLGVPNGLMYPSSVYNGLFDLYHGPTPLGHWDFTDISTLYKDNDSYDNEVTANNDLIGRVKNKAYINDPDTDKIGTFMRAELTAERPTFKTGGANGHSYAEFDSSNGTNLFCNSFSSTYGAHSDAVLSTQIMVNWGLSIWVIGEPADNDTDGDEEVVLSYSGYRGVTTSLADEDQSTLFTLEREDDKDIIARWIIAPPTGSVPVTPNLITATQPFSHWGYSTGNPAIINIRTNLQFASCDECASYIYKNNTPDVGQFIYGPLSGLFAQEGYSQMDNQWDDTKLAAWAIGHKLTSAGALIGSDGFDGKIYEILVYNLNVPNESQRAAMVSYFMSKYDFTYS